MLAPISHYVEYSGGCLFFVSWPELLMLMDKIPAPIRIGRLYAKNRDDLRRSLRERIMNHAVFPHKIELMRAAFAVTGYKNLMAIPEERLVWLDEEFRKRNL